MLLAVSNISVLVAQEYSSMVDLLTLSTTQSHVIVSECRGILIVPETLFYDSAVNRHKSTPRRQNLNCLFTVDGMGWGGVWAAVLMRLPDRAA